MSQFPTPLDRGCAIKAAATAIITCIDGRRPAIIRAPQHSHYSEVRSTTKVVRMLADVERNWSSMGAAFAWDRKVVALTKAIAAETRVLS